MQSAICCDQNSRPKFVCELGAGLALTDRHILAHILVIAIENTALFRDCRISAFKPPKIVCRLSSRTLPGWWQGCEGLLSQVCWYCRPLGCQIRKWIRVSCGVGRSPGGPGSTGHCFGQCTTVRESLSLVATGASECGPESHLRDADWRMP